MLCNFEVYTQVKEKKKSPEIRKRARCKKTKKETKRTFDHHLTIPEPQIVIRSYETSNPGSVEYFGLVLWWKTRWGTEKVKITLN